MNLINNLEFYLVFSSILFVLGLLAALTRRNAIGIFMGVELMLNAAGLNFVAFQSFRKNIGGGDWLHGHVFSLFIIILAAIEAAVALAIVLRIFAAKRNIDPYAATELRG
ncbi:MAG TPA: NADH-quinone oxidoreductase subunit NuoK [Bdellovibrionota bacterium]|jgi:NADH-quinone oxidoreductase subunit K|nr:NADH-quinone oxidoreductase subunit NuoK [Bdellovibrionota bacterium]